MKFDAYDYVGVIAPGAIPVVTLSLLYPDLAPALADTLSLGDLGLLLILAFIAGQLLQAVGNFWEWLIWLWPGGMPTTWASKPETRLLSPSQLARLETKLGKHFSVDRSALKEGRGPIREIVVNVRQRGKPDRIDKFNQNYGLMRGVAAGFLVSAIMVMFQKPDLWRASLLLQVLGGITTYRMVRFGIHYARETYAEYLSLPDPLPSHAPASHQAQGSTT